MPRTTYRRCKYCEQWHDIANWPDNHRDEAPKRSHLAAPRIDRDGLDDLWHPVDGKLYDSKSAFRQTTKASGGEEVGNEVQRDTRKMDTVTKDEVQKAAAMVSQGYKPGVHGTASSEGWS